MFREAKRAQRGDTPRMWQGIQSITNYTSASPACDSDASLLDSLNSYYAGFEARNDVTARKTIPPSEYQVLCLTTADMRKTLRRVNPRKAAGPDKDHHHHHPRAEEVSSVLHLDNRDTYVRMLFIDFSSAFNTIIPQHLIEKLCLLGTNTSLCNWILDFLTGRPQSVRIGNSTSITTTLNTGTGAAQSTAVHSADSHCAAMHSSNHIIKFANDTTVVGLISKNDESAYREEVQDFDPEVYEFFGVSPCLSLSSTKYTLN
ncbi:hypothetical protein QTP70_020015 [Hemibagrus guttatus]|uniref:Reverse transcriptase domain-containing protein n=1 Tax=Hemibagrus guttatus TaxID=175788 RepID=A0AAE0QE78_9TELE|nr:hypothetical protein QTP70_020015 [Hemibagrus guttatus]